MTENNSIGMKDFDESLGPASSDDRPFLERTEKTGAKENSLLAARIKDIDQDREERKKYSSRAYWLAVSWSVAVLAILLLHGCGQKAGWFKLPDAVLIALSAGLSAGLIGAFVAVATYLFKKGR